jgi:hypothetical protein
MEKLKDLLQTYEDLSFQGNGLTDQQLFDFVYSIKQNLGNAFQDSMNELVEKLDGESFKIVYNVINKNFNRM